MLTRKYNPNSARPRIFDGAAEAKLITLDPLSEPRKALPDGAFVSLEEKVVELHIVERASDTTIRRTLRRHILKAASQAAAMGDSARRQCGVCRHHGRRPGSSDHDRTDPQRPLLCLDETSKQLIMSTRARRSPPNLDNQRVTIANTNAMGVANLFAVLRAG